MRAVIIATGLNANLSALNERYPLPLLPVVDRPFIQHIVEYLVDRGVTDFDFVLSHLPEKIEHLLGNGARWGSQFRFHLTRDASQPYGALKSLSCQDANDSLLLVHADRLPQLPENLNGHAEQRARPSLYCLPNAVASSAESMWTGWAWLSKQYIESLPSDLDEKALESDLSLMARLQGAIIEVPRALSVRSYEELLAAQSAVLTKAFPGLVLSGSEADEGIWLSRNVSLHPTVILIAPVYIGENCRIATGIQLGNAVVGHNCVLDAHCTVANSAIFPGSYVGEALELEDVIVDKNLLVNARLGAAIPVADNFILGSLSDTQIRAGFSRLLGRVAALLLLALTWPVLLITALFLKLTRRGPVLVRHECVSLPAPAEGAQWRTFHLWSFHSERGPSGTGMSRLSGLFLRFLPAMLNIARGELSFVGVCPRSKAEVKLLSHDWQALYLRTKAGIVTEAEVLYGPQPDEDELYSAEAFYSATAGFTHDLRLLLRYFAQLLKTPSVAPERREDWNAGSETVPHKF